MSSKLSVLCPDIPKKGLLRRRQRCQGENCPLGEWHGYDEPRKIAEPQKDSIIPIRISVSISNPICGKYGVVSGYGVAGKYRKNKGLLHREPWNSELVSSSSI